MPRRRRLASSPPPARPDWLSRNRWGVLALLVAIAIGIRAIYFVQFNATPFVEMHHWRQADMNYYDTWAREIAAGDWLSTSVRVPMHRWHREIAARYFATHPDERNALAQDSSDPEEAVWSRWMRLPRFYQDPLYAYLVALTYKILGPNVRYVFAWQLVAGVLSVLLIWDLSRRIFGDRAAAVAGALAALSGPLVFYEMVLLRDSLIVFVGLALVWLADRAFRHSTAVTFGLLGLALGLSTLLKSTFLLLAAGLVAAVIVVFRRRRRDLAVSTAALIIGIAAGLAPLITRNVAVGAPALAMASSGPLTFVASNEVGYLPEVGFGINTPILVRFLGETDGGWFAALRESLKSHSAGSYSSLLWRKWTRVWHWYEIPNNENYYYMKTQVAVLGWLAITFAACGPLALVGLVLAAPRRRDVWPLYLLVLFTLVPMIGFYVLARFRIALGAALIPFTAFAVVRIVEWVQQRRVGPAAAAAAAIGVLALWTGRPLERHQLRIRMADWILPYSVYYQPRVYEALDARDWRRAATWYLAFFRHEPTTEQILDSNDPTLPTELADMHMECAKILKMSGQPEQAEQQMAEANRLMRLAGVL